VSGWVHYLDYDKIIKRYSENFGQENIGIFLLEDLVIDASEYAHRACSFIGVDDEVGVSNLVGFHSNEGRSVRLTAYARWHQKMMPNFKARPYVPVGIAKHIDSFIKGGRKASVEIPERLSEKIRDRFRDGNCRLAEKYGLPLADRGYPV